MTEAETDIYDLVTTAVENGVIKYERKIGNLTQKHWSDDELKNIKLPALRFESEVTIQQAVRIYNFLHKQQHSPDVQVLIPDLLVMFAHQFLCDTSGRPIFDSTTDWIEDETDIAALTAFVQDKGQPGTQSVLDSVLKEIQKHVPSADDMIKEADYSTNVKTDYLTRWFGALCFNYIRAVVKPGNVENHMSLNKAGVVSFNRAFNDLYKPAFGIALVSDCKPFDPKVLTYMSSIFQRPKHRVVGLLLKATKILNMKPAEEVSSVLHAFGMLTIQEFGLSPITWLRRASERLGISDGQLLAFCNAPLYRYSYVEMSKFMFSYGLSQENYDKLLPRVKAKHPRLDSKYYQVARLIDRSYFANLTRRANNNMLWLLQIIYTRLLGPNDQQLSESAGYAPPTATADLKVIASDAAAIVDYVMKALMTGHRSKALISAQSKEMQDAGLKILEKMRVNQGSSSTSLVYTKVDKPIDDLKSQVKNILTQRTTSEQGDSEEEQDSGDDDFQEYT